MLSYVLLMALMATVMEIGVKATSVTGQQRQEIPSDPPLQSKSDHLHSPSSSAPSIVNDHQPSLDAVPIEEHPFKVHYNSDYNAGIKIMHNVPEYFRYENAPKSKSQ
jgi:hypothetical protein